MRRDLCSAQTRVASAFGSSTTSRRHSPSPSRQVLCSAVVLAVQGVARGTTAVVRGLGDEKGAGQGQRQAEEAAGGGVRVNSHWGSGEDEESTKRWK